MRTSSPRSSIGRLRGPVLKLAVAVGLVASGIAAAGPARADSYLRGPDPTLDSVSATTGPFATTTKKISGNGFGGATVYYPTTAPQGKYGVVAILPGFISLWTQIAWLGPRLASQGFVVIGEDSTTPADFPSVRADEFKAGIKAAAADPTVAGIGDFSRVAVAGWSMGGGGALDAGIGNSTYKALIGIAPFEFVNKYSRVTTPSLILGGSSDVVASPASHAKPFYNAIKAPKEYIELSGADHFFTTKPNTVEAVAMISWLKLWVDGDARYSQFVCPKFAITTGVSANLSSC